jgi:hypothetical protein
VTTRVRTQVEHAGQHLFRNADAVVLHPEHGGTVVLLDGQADMTFFGGIPGRINKQVGHDLNQSSDIALRLYRRRWGDDLQCVPKSLDQRTADPNGQARNVRKISRREDLVPSTVCVFKGRNNTASQNGSPRRWRPASRLVACNTRIRSDGSHSFIGRLGMNRTPESIVTVH